MPDVRWIDLSHPLDSETPVYEGTEPFEAGVVETTQDIVAGRHALNCSRYGIGAHCGTHMDAPFHFLDGGRTIDQILPEQCCGVAVLVDLRGLLEGGEIGRRQLEPYAKLICQHRKIVIHTGWWMRWKEPDYFSGHPVLDASAAELLVDCKVELLGVDTPSPDVYPSPAHLGILGIDGVIVENLKNLHNIQNPLFEFHAAPLRIEGREASPVRALARI